MDTPLLMVLGPAAGVVAVGCGCLVWRWFDRRRVAPLAAADRVQVVEIEVGDGYRPGTIRVRAGQPVRLLFRRVDDDPCSARVYFADPPLVRHLAPFATTAVSFTPHRVGSHLFTCEEGRYRGHLIVAPPAAPTSGGGRRRADTGHAAPADSQPHHRLISSPPQGSVPS